MSPRRRRALLVGAVAALAIPPLIIIGELDRDRPASTAAPTTPAGSSAPDAATQAATSLRKAPPIVFSSQGRSRYVLYATDSRGGKPTLITDRPAKFPAWSSDGRTLVFVTEAGGFASTRTALAAIQPDGEIRDILSGPQVPSHPSVDQRQNRVVYQSTLVTQSGAAGARGRSSIDAVPLEGGQQRTVVDQGGATYQPAVSPDGSRLAVVIAEAGCRRELCPQRLVVYEPDGTEPRTLVGEGAAAAPAWAADGRRIAFTWDRGRGPGVWVIDVQSGELTQVTSGSPADAEPTWSPDGGELAISRECDIFIVPVDGGEAKNATNTPRCEISPAWRPD